MEKRRGLTCVLRKLVCFAPSCGYKRVYFYWFGFVGCGGEGRQGGAGAASHLGTKGGREGDEGEALGKEGRGGRGAEGKGREREGLLGRQACLRAALRAAYFLFSSLVFPCGGWMDWWVGV